MEDIKKKEHCVKWQEQNKVNWKSTQRRRMQIQ